MIKTKILLAEDDKNLGSIIKEYLEMNSFEVELATNGKEAWEKFQQNVFDIGVIDVMMPIKDGFSLVKDLRGIGNNTPILFLTARDMIEDKREGFLSGGDDYLTKPFSMEELILRLGALNRRKRSEKTSNGHEKSFKVGSYTLDVHSRYLKREGFEKRLTQKEVELLRLLIVNKNGLLPRTLALKKIWRDDSYFNSRSMDVFISKLRKYLSYDKTLEILNVHGEGFKLIEG